MRHTRELTIAESKLSNFSNPAEKLCEYLNQKGAFARLLPHLRGFSEGKWALLSQAASKFTYMLTAAIRSLIPIAHRNREKKSLVQIRKLLSLPRNDAKFDRRKVLHNDQLLILHIYHHIFIFMV